VPAKWRPTEPGIELTLVLWPQADGTHCLRALPPEQMAVLKRDLDAMPNSDPKKLVLKRYIGSQSAQAPLDKVGRICIPDSMAQLAGITDQAMMVGLLDVFEIWNPERYERVKAADALLAPEAFKLMG
jgi:MraZ protein